MDKFWYTDWYTWNKKILNFTTALLSGSRLVFFPSTVATPMTLDVISSLTLNIFVNKVLTASLTDLDLSAANFKASYQ